MAVDRCRKVALLIVAVLEMVLCLVPGMALAISDTSEKNYEPVAITGFNVDVVADGDLPTEQLKNTVSGYIDLNNEGGGHTYFAGGYGKHLPDDGHIVLDDGMAFQLGDYGNSNALQLVAPAAAETNAGKVSQGTLVFDNPTNEYKKIAILCTAAGDSSDGANLKVTPLYAPDNTPKYDDNENAVSQSFTIPDWNTRPVYDSHLMYLRIRASDGYIDDEFALYVAKEIDVDTSKELTAIKFENTGVFENTGGEIATIFAVSALPLRHDWGYSTFGASITATCNNTRCFLWPQPTLAIVAPTLTVEGGEGSAEATVTANETWRTVNELPEIPEVVYWSGDEKLDEAPTTVGSYKAQITVNNVTATKSATAELEYTIEEKTPAVITRKPEAKNLIHDGNAQELVSAGEATGGTMTYALGSDVTNAPVDGWDTAVPRGTDVGTYYVWYKAVGDANHIDSAADCVSATIAAPEPEPAVGLCVAYSGHAQTYGDLAEVKDGATLGTTGQSKRLEAVRATVFGIDGAAISYRAHLQGIGWTAWVANGELMGTIGEARRMEAVQMTLSGANDQHVWYRVHSQTWGWLGWAHDGEPAGTAGQEKRIEAIEVRVLQGDAAPEGYVAGKASYVGAAKADVHLQGIGWTGAKSALSFGTTGQSRRLEAVKFWLAKQPEAGGISYEVHVQGKGWMSAKADGAMAGTTGQSRRLEAVKISLTGDMKADYSVWYRVHSQTYGWLGWTSDGKAAGTTGLSKRAEAIEVQILPKGQVPSGYDANVAACRGK